MQAERIPEIEAMRMGVEYTFKVELRKFSVYLRPLANSELVKCYADVALHMRQIPENARTEITADNLKAREFLKKASSPFGRYEPQITDIMLDEMTTDEMMYLYKEWQAVCDRVNPMLEKMSIERVKELVEEVKKNLPADLDYQLTQLSFGQMLSIAHYLLTKGD